LISRVKHLSGRIFARMLKDHDIEINPAQGRIMFALWQQDGIPIQELAQRTSLGKSTLTSMLDRLEDMGYITRKRSKEDRRIILIQRTAKDRALQDTYERVSDEMSAVCFKGFSASEIQALENTLERVLENRANADSRHSKDNSTDVVEQRT
ncbi:MarR family transcriptional regulator, partial [Candidatus Bipolaricaulota bacterium]|nr:MarR family transcriptional regulator [Candidatus Bipolaricaulota bacterium]